MNDAQLINAVLGWERGEIQRWEGRYDRITGGPGAMYNKGGVKWSGERRETLAERSKTLDAKEIDV
jgi:hypothetical protein